VAVVAADSLNWGEYGVIRIVVDENIPLAEEAFGTLGDVRRVAGRSLGREELLNADALIVRSVTRVDGDLLRATPVRFVGTATIGVDHVDRVCLAEAGIGFASAAGCNARSVVEYIVAALLEVALERDLSLHGCTLGIVGHGNIGSRLAALAPALGLRVLVNDPPLERAGHPGHFVPLDHVLAESDFVTFHVPKIGDGPDRTTGLIGERELAAMKPTAWLLNTSRGDVVLGDALKRALTAGKIAGAILDVWENEPAIDRDLMDAVMLGSPHVAGYSLEGKTNGTAMMHDALAAHFGLDHQWRPDLSPPEAALIKITGNQARNVAILAEAVRKSYDLRRDDAALRAGRGLQDAQWRLHFDRLRREYPIRREFGNYKVKVPAHLSQLEETFRQLGFRTERSA